MKALYTIFTLLIAISAFGQAEVVEKTYPYTGQELDVDLEFGTELTINAWAKNEILVKITYEVNEGENNEAVVLDLDDYTDRLSVDIELDERKMRDARECCCEGDGKHYWSRGRGNQVCAEVKVEVWLPPQSDLYLETIIADVEIKGMYGDVEVETVTGDIDLTWDEDKGARVEMKTTTGDVYTNLKMDRKRDRGLSVISSHNLTGTIKGGDKEIMLKTVTSNIYLRKSGS